MIDIADTTPAVANLARVKALIARMEADFARPPGSVSLIAVSKTFPAEAIAPVLDAGQRIFGENYVQETKGKWPALRERFPDARVHMIGPLQSNKAGEAARLFDCIQTLDRESLAKELARAIQKEGRAPELLVQVNTGSEPQKGGVEPTEAESFVTRCREVHGLAISGLMCIPPADQPPSPHFALLAKLAKNLGLPLLSMGMSADFEAAIQMGATHVRVGSAIFGAR
ncbi:MAG: YggS family pyridoxal phosphate-dependent enzyme [Beijerinckiaceae bacterium]